MAAQEPSDQHNGPEPKPKPGAKPRKPKPPKKAREKWLTQGSLLRLLGLAGMAGAAAAPFYRGEDGIVGPQVWHTWASGELGDKVLVCALFAVPAFLLLTLIKPNKRPSRVGSFVLGLAGSALAWVAMLGASAESGVPSMGWQWMFDGLGIGLAAYLVFSVAAGVSSLLRTRAGARFVFVEAPLLVALTAAIVSAAAFSATVYASSKRQAKVTLGVAVLPARDVFGREEDGSLALRVRISNPGERSVRIATRPAAADPGGDACSLRLAVCRDASQAWQDVPNPAWAGRWPTLDFRTVRELKPGEDWILEGTLFRDGAPTVCAERPAKVAVTLLGPQGEQLLRRVVDVAAPQAKPKGGDQG